ncbi:queuosine salvage family protein [Patescibacteria group bacterium]|nr:queuosine salvage family protein [Patescibacteria group bacterium]
MNKILETTKFVIENYDLVKINHEKVAEFSKNFNPDKTDHWLNAAPFNFSHFSDENKLHFLFVFNALSFSYWGEPKWTVEYKDKKHDGAWGMILALGRGIEEGAALTNFEFCSKLSKEEFSHVLRGNIEIPLLEERWKILREIGLNMTAKFGGKAKNLITEANGDAQKLLELIVQNFPSFLDAATYKGKEVYFYKRAQLLVADIFQIFGGKNFGALENMDQITACADYKLPLILRNLGILEYAPALAEKIDNKTEIQKGSAEETEIRASTIWAVEFIKEEVKKRSPQIMSFQINDDLWLATQGNNNGKPYHRTRTTAY